MAEGVARDGRRRLPALGLAYHSVLALNRRRDPSYLSVAPERFVRQVSSLRRRGYRFVTATELGARVRVREDVDGLCALTFDDGAEDNATVLPGLLERLGVPASLFVCEDLLGMPNPFFADEAGLRFMTREQLGVLAHHPLIEIGSHTSAHTELTDLDGKRAGELLASSRASLEELLDRPVLSLAYPRCGYSPEVPPAAERAGFECAFACGPRGAWRPYEMPRLIMNSWDRAPTFAAKTRGWFDHAWGSPPVRFARRVGARLGLAPPAPPPPPDAP